MKDVMAKGPKCCQKLSRYGEFLADGAMILYTVGIVIVYIVFITVTLISAFNISMDVRIAMVIVTAGLIPVVLLPNWKIVAVASILGTILMALAIGCLLYFIYRKDDEGFLGYNEMKLFGGWLGSALLMGSMLLGMQNINVVVAVDAVMKHPNHLIGKHYLGVFPLTMIGILVFYVFLGLSGYMKYGSEAMGSVTMNLPRDDPLAVSIEVMFVACIVCAFPVFLTYLSGVIYNKYTPQKLKKKGYELCMELIIRISALIICLAAAVIIPEIDILTALMGSLTISLCSLFIPALIDYLYRWSESPDNKVTFLMVSDIGIMIYSLLMLVITTYSAISAYIEGYSD